MVHSVREENAQLLLSTNDNNDVDDDDDVDDDGDDDDGDDDDEDDGDDDDDDDDGDGDDDDDDDDDGDGDDDDDHEKQDGGLRWCYSQGDFKWGFRWGRVERSFDMRLQARSWGFGRGVRIYLKVL